MLLFALALLSQTAEPTVVDEVPDAGPGAADEAGDDDDAVDAGPGDDSIHDNSVVHEEALGRPLVPVAPVVPPVPVAPVEPAPMELSPPTPPPLGSWVLTTSLVTAGGTATGVLLGFVPLLVPFTGAGFFAIGLPLAGAGLAGGLSLYAASDSALVGIIGGVAAAGATLVVAVGGALLVDGVTSPHLENNTAKVAGWSVGAVAGSALAVGLLTWAFQPSD